MKSLFKNFLVAALLVPLLAFATTPVRDHGLPYTTTGTPSNILGNPGDVALDPATGVLYLKDATAGWQASYTPSASSYNPAAVAITGGSITGTSISGSTGSFTTLSASGNSTLAGVTATSLTNSGLTAKSFVYSGVGGLMSSTAAPTNGQLLIGSTGNAPVAATLTGTANQITFTNGPGSVTASIPSTFAIPGTISSLNAVSTVGNGVPIVVARADFLTQGAVIASTPIYTVPAGLGGRYRVTMNESLVTPDGASSTLPNTNVAWTDADSGGTGPNANIGATSTANTTNAVSVGSITVNAKAGTAINISTVGYASGTAGAMKYDARYVVEYLGL